jgi:hypothetical protein
MTFSYGNRKASAVDQHDGDWVKDPRTLRVGDVFSTAGPGTSSYSERVVRKVTVGPLVPSTGPGARMKYDKRTVTVEYSQVAQPHLLGSLNYSIYPFSDDAYLSSTVYLVKRLTTDEDIERLERELATARANKAAEEAQIRAERIEKAARAIGNNAAVYSWSRRAAERLDDAGLLAK